MATAVPASPPRPPVVVVALPPPDPPFPPVMVVTVFHWILGFVVPTTTIPAAESRLPPRPPVAPVFAGPPPPRPPLTLSTALLGSEADGAPHAEVPTPPVPSRTGA